jgi:hypothetical protein
MRQEARGDATNTLARTHAPAAGWKRGREGTQRRRGRCQTCSAEGRREALRVARCSEGLRISTSERYTLTNQPHHLCDHSTQKTTRVNLVIRPQEGLLVPRTKRPSSKPQSNLASTSPSRTPWKEGAANASRCSATRTISWLALGCSWTMSVLTREHLS